MKKPPSMILVLLATCAIFGNVSAFGFDWWGPKKPEGLYRDSRAGVINYNFRRDGVVYMGSDPTKAGPQFSIEKTWEIVSVTPEVRRVLKSLDANYLIVIRTGNKNDPKSFDSALYFSGDDLIDAQSNVRYISASK